MKFIILLIFIISSVRIFAQNDTSTPLIKYDSNFNKLLQGLSKEERLEIVNEFKKMSSDDRESIQTTLNIFYSLPQSSKKQLIQNIDTNYTNILAAKTFLNSLAQNEYLINIDFRPLNEMLKTDENVIGISIERKNNKGQSFPIFHESKINLKSQKLDSLLKLTSLKKIDLEKLKHYLDAANCISISNGNLYQEICKIGYSRSGIGQYSYLIFDKPLTDDERKKYNNGCDNIFYKNNIVLVYDTGAIGSPCFPDK